MILWRFVADFLVVRGVSAVVAVSVVLSVEVGCVGGLLDRCVSVLECNGLDAL